MGQSMGSPSVSPEGQQDQAEESYGYQVMTVEEINKRQLGKLIIKYCGHEGTTDNDQTASIRKLLQRAITNLEPQQKQYPGVWKDAELKIFDLYGNGYVVKSGQGSVKFEAQITGKGDAELSKIKDESWWTSMKALLMRQNAPQLQIEGAPPDQSSVRQGWFSSISSRFSRGSQPKESQSEGLSPSDNKDEARASDLPPQMDAGNPSKDGHGALHGQHLDQSLGGERGGSQNTASCSSVSSNPIDSQQADNLPGSECQTGNDESGSASQVQIQATGGTQPEQKEKEGSMTCDCNIG